MKKGTGLTTHIALTLLGPGGRDRFDPQQIKTVVTWRPPEING